MDYFLATFAGSLVIIQMSLNSSLSLRIGVFRATTVNYIAGLFGIGVIILVLGTWNQASTLPVPWYAWTGGVLGVLVVSASNLVLPRIPVVSVAGLLFVGQVTAGLVVDAIKEDHFDLPKLAGSALVLAGLALHYRIDHQSKKSAPNP